MTAPAYLTRLRLEGTVLTAWGLLGTIILIVAVPGATQNPASTVIQEIIVAALLGFFGPRSVRSSIAKSERLAPNVVGSGEPTPLWHIAAIVIALTLIAGFAAGWDAGLRVAVGCTLVGLAQAVLLAAIVERDQLATGRAYYRVKGSRILRGTRLGYLSDPRVVATRPGAAPSPART